MFKAFTFPSTSANYFPVFIQTLSADGVSHTKLIKDNKECMINMKADPFGLLNIT